MRDNRPIIKICFLWIVLVAFWCCETPFEAAFFVPGAMLVAHTLYYRKIRLAVASPEYLESLMAVALVKMDSNDVMYHKEDAQAKVAFARVLEVFNLAQEEILSFLEEDSLEDESCDEDQ